MSAAARGRFGALKRYHLWIAVFSFGCVLLAGVVDLGRPSPGPLSAVHARIDELEGRFGCSGCHGGWGGSMTDSCLECHTEIGEQVELGEGVHGIVGAERAQACSLCHSDHHGADFAMVNPQSFFQAGLGDPEDFDHDVLGFPFEGRHTELECADCHSLADEPVLPEGGRRFAGLDRNCAECHEDPHAGAMAQACADCHQQTGFDDLFAVGHDEHLPLVGGHAGVDCRSCHAEGEVHALEFVGDRGAPGARACLECHASPHAASFSAGVSALADLPRAEACVACHALEHTSFREEELVLTDEQHATSGFDLDDPHAGLSCDACHAPDEPRFEQRYPGRDRDACEACHADAHGGQFETGPFAGRGCIACHERHDFEPHTFDVEAHALAFLPLDGAHAEQDCATCHTDPHEPSGLAEPDATGAPGATGRGATPRLFRGIPNRCQDCHADAHTGFFDERLEATGAASKGVCATCHQTQSFADLGVTAQTFDHESWTGFAVDGAHKANGCESCHPRAAEADATGRTFGRVSEQYGDVQNCADCHADPHGGEFEDGALPTEVDGRESCARCHVGTSFRAFPDGFDHERWTGFALRGPHAEASCTACHAPLRAMTLADRTFERALGTACADCHADPHAGQFREQGATDCSRCHATAGQFELVFDHGRNTSFPLDGRHAQLDCGACHRSWELESGASVTRYRPLGTACDTCHAVPAPELIRVRSKRP